jgi:hypothetical protein
MVFVTELDVTPISDFGPSESKRQQIIQAVGT